MSYNSSLIRGQFPFLKTGNPTAYLDSASTTQKPEAVLNAIQEVLTEKNANPNRGVYPLAEAATMAYDDARKSVAQFIRASAHEIVFTKNATEAINLVARSFGETLRSGDRVALTVMEHHSNIIPWQQLASRSGIGIDWIGVDEEGQPDMSSLQIILKKGKTKLVAITGLSNVLGSMPDLKVITNLAHGHGACVLIDAAQLVAHARIDVRNIDCDFLAFSGHKLYGPTGIGVLYGKTELMEKMPPFLGGGDMIRSVTMEGFTPAELPRKFEAGTMPVAEAVGLAAAIRWMEDIGPEAIFKHEALLLEHTATVLSNIQGVTIFGPKDPSNRKGCISFTVDGVHPHDLAEVLGRKGVCIRAGHHCTQPLHGHLGIPASARLSVAAYNTKEEIDRAGEAIREAQKIFAS